MIRALALVMLALCAACSTPGGYAAGPRLPRPVYVQQEPLEYDLAPMVRSMEATAYNVQAAPYAAWKQHSDTVAANNARQWINQGPRICGPLYGSSDIYCH
jgi:hypothetical protein